MRKVSFIFLWLLGCSTGDVKWAFDPHREEGVHADVEIEWWYHWGFLKDENGNEWGAFSFFFRTRNKNLPLTRYFLYDLTGRKTGSRRHRSAAGADLLAVAGLPGQTKLPPPHEVIPGHPLEK